MAPPTFLDTVNQLQDWLTDYLSGYAVKKWIRIIAIVGAYLLLRPFLVHLGAKKQKADHEEAVPPTGKISSNSLRGQVEVPEDTDEEDDKTKGEATGAQWGKKARRRQRQAVKKILEADEKKRMMDDWPSDDDIEDLLPSAAVQEEAAAALEAEEK